MRKPTKFIFTEPIYGDADLDTLMARIIDTFDFSHLEEDHTENESQDEEAVI